MKVGSVGSKLDLCCSGRRDGTLFEDFFKMYMYDLLTLGKPFNLNLTFQSVKWG